MLVGELSDVIEIDAFVFAPNLIADHVISLAREVQFVAVGEVSAVGEIEAHDRVAGLNHGGIGCLVGLRSGMRLNVDVFGAEEFFSHVRAPGFPLHR